MRPLPGVHNGRRGLLARLRAATRRTEPSSQPWDSGRVTTKDLTLDLLAKKARRGEEQVRLTPTEWHFLEVLVRNRGKLVSQRHLQQEVWGSNFPTHSNHLRVYMAQLRRKLEADPSHPEYLITAPGMGYRFET